jgi:hypothetical protein
MSRYAWRFPGFILFMDRIHLNPLFLKPSRRVNNLPAVSLSLVAGYFFCGLRSSAESAAFFHSAASLRSDIIDHRSGKLNTESSINRQPRAYFRPPGKGMNKKKLHNHEKTGLGRLKECINGNVLKNPS